MRLTIKIYNNWRWATHINWWFWLRPTREFHNGRRYRTWSFVLFNFQPVIVISSVDPVAMAVEMLKVALEKFVRSVQK